VSGGAIGRAVLGALWATAGPVTVRDVAERAGVRRDSAGQVLRRLEGVGWAVRVHGEMRSGKPDLWSATADARAQWQVDGEEAGSRGHAKMKAASSSPPPRVLMPHVALTALGVAIRDGGRGAGEPVRLAGGELQEQVLCLLEAMAPRSVGPVELSRLLGGRSQGAVANACKRLVGSGAVACTCPAPLRYAAVAVVSGE
jgi:hypothetical protein